MADTENLELMRALAGARTGYEERFGWPVSIEVRHARLVMRLGCVADAVVMPRGLGARVLTELRIALLAGPVLADTTGRWWMFLTRPAHAVTPWAHDELRRAGVHPAPGGSSVVVPSEFERKSRCPWIEPPRPLAQLPPWPAVIGTARRLVSVPARNDREQRGLRPPDGGGRPSATAPPGRAYVSPVIGVVKQHVQGQLPGPLRVIG